LAAHVAAADPHTGYALESALGWVLTDAAPTTPPATAGEKAGKTLKWNSAGTALEWAFVAVVTIAGNNGALVPTFADPCPLTGTPIGYTT
jgi:hypothetical protein